MSNLHIFIYCKRLIDFLQIKIYCVWGIIHNFLWKVVISFFGHWKKQLPLSFLRPYFLFTLWSWKQRWLWVTKHVAKRPTDHVTAFKSTHKIWSPQPQVHTTHKIPRIVTAKYQSHDFFGSSRPIDMGYFIYKFNYLTKIIIFNFL